MAVKLTRWFIFSIVVALLPIWFHLYRIPGNEPLALLITSCSNGELLLMTAAISGAALGALIGSGPNMLVAKLVVGSGCMTLLLLASMGFAYVASTPGQDILLTPEAITFGSLAIFAFGIVSSGSCIALAKY
uniref:Uncharacterized protein n=1 Tax=Candidatus Kentrum sp. FM TaxID=2126340 RepID=A0A450WKC3_9GAMM|nr:MAG: hypothetical protein BECKFM1743C_GA0114222_101268 [Candidatus Kentron sp. FM]VFJ53705.1 MAG: hypothetical protein BECKFM1743A_GA0114220_101186 [Candidatus Kentron sp. FM]VFK17448.1 MAG: hypothetical protein BECKFM1743B_GA0114221_104802 [Candidatus Kentron sp. FM]